MPAYLVVRAVVPDPADRADFDRWYHAEHLPDALRAFAAQSAWRGWSKSDPAVHCAYYRFASADDVAAIMASDAIKALVAEFDRCWGARVQRTREILEVADEMQGAA